MYATPDDFRKFIETEVLKCMKNLNEKENVGDKLFQEIARLTLDLIKPGMTVEELYKNAVKLDDRHPELAPVVFAVMKQYETVHEKKAIDAVSGLIKEGRYDDAQNAVKKVLEFKIHN